MTAVTNSAEGGTDTATANSGNSGGSSGTALTISSGGGTVIYSSSYAAHGKVGYYFTPNATATCLADLDAPSAASSFRFRMYFKFDALPATTQSGWPFAFRNTTGGLIGALNMNTAGKLQVFLVSSGTFSTNALSAGNIYRLEVTGTGFNTAATAVTANVYTFDTATLVATCSISGVTTTQLVDRARAGKQTAGDMGAFGIDDLAFETGSSTEFGVVNITASPAAGLASATGVANDATVSISSGVSAGVASATGTVEFDSAGGSISLNYLVGSEIAATVTAYDATTKVSTGLSGAATATGAALDATATQSGVSSPAAGLAAATGAALDALVNLAPGVYPDTAGVTGDALDPTILIFTVNTNAQAEVALASGEAFDTTVDILLDIPYYFSTPTVREHSSVVRHGLFSRLYLQRGRTVLVTGTTVTLVDNPSVEQMLAADAVYVGGRTYQITVQQAQLLTHAGYGAWVSLDPIQHPIDIV